ncbi:class I SAM-dependent methyltransferase [Bradyrhizobium sp. KB893862 SZCCT0404]|uniref:class I SAM-dependent methyltransferase n=1 Tax=Bradyrhizobium sp. KB893862 SZCCT0404 TaxID=2807672 RepID=UPI001BAB757B|nr:class I SAM-dependent methyltransferase [Bradyrhizobium sp. KB893862 SZCCT0404]MBR1173924.1 class I SAM-dependent methyltransferase [Bradyrhizobium sp. KB893862 SZCCT0404]
MHQVSEGVRAGELSLITAASGVGRSKWAEFYNGRTGPGYLAYVRERYRPFISAIASRIRPNDLVLEIGCGTGTITKALCDLAKVQGAPRSVVFAASDADPEMVQTTRARLWNDNAAVFALDCTNAKHFTEAEVVHSHGMLEHFDDHTIRQVIHNFRKARVQVHYVPGLYDAPTFGDERLMSVEQWEDICAPDQIITFNDGLDYALIFERK